MTNPFEPLDPLQKHAGDVDLSWDALHHTVGKGATQAAPGNHKHTASEVDGLDTTLDGYVEKAGDTMSGRLLMQDTPDVAATPGSPAASIGIIRDVYPMFTMYKVRSAADTAVWNIYISGPADDPNPTLTFAPVAYTTGTAFRYFRMFLDGRMTIGADPINPLDVATKAYVDSKLATLKAELLGKDKPGVEE